MRSTYLQNKIGFTLIELLLYLSIASVLVIIISSVSINMLRTTHKTEILQDVHYANTLILATFERAAAGAYAVSSPIGSATSSSVSFAMYDAALDPTVFTLVDDVLHITEGTANAVPLHTETTESAVKFINVTPEDGYDSVHASFTISVSKASQLQSFDVQEQTQTTVTLNHTP